MDPGVDGAIPTAHLSFRPEPCIRHGIFGTELLDLPTGRSADTSRIQFEQRYFNTLESIYGNHGDTKLGDYLMRNAANVIRWIDKNVFLPLRKAIFNPKPRVLFEVWNIIGWEAQWPVMQTLLGEGAVHVFVVFAGEHDEALLGLFDGAIASGAISLSRRKVRHMLFDLVVRTDAPRIYYWRSPRGVFIHHGSSFGNLAQPYALGLLGRGTITHLLCLCSAEQNAAVRMLGGNAYLQTAVAGAVKLDLLLQTDPSTSKRKLGINPNRTTIVVSSHWTEGALFCSVDLATLATELSRIDADFLITCHHALLRHACPASQEGWGSYLAKTFHYPNMQVVLEPTCIADIQAGADIAVGDKSSFLVEYSVLRRPTFRFIDNGWADLDETYRRLESEALICFKTVEELVEKLKHALHHFGIDRSARQRWIEHCFSNLGSATSTSAKYITTLAETGRFESQ